MLLVVFLAAVVGFALACDRGLDWNSANLDLHRLGSVIEVWGLSLVVPFAPAVIVAGSPMSRRAIALVVPILAVTAAILLGFFAAAGAG